MKKYEKERNPSDFNIMGHDTPLVTFLRKMEMNIDELGDCVTWLEDTVEHLCNENSLLRNLCEDLSEKECKKIKIPHRCPICNGDMCDDKDKLCWPCEGSGIVWG